jgi:hypothetical protein
MRWRLYGSLGLCATLVMPSLATAQQVRAGAEFRANSYTSEDQRRPDVHVKANGDFIVAWAGYNGLDTSYYGVLGQRYDAAGTLQGAEFLINTYTPNFQFRPQAASDRRGNFVIVWSSLGQDGAAYGVFGQRFNTTGAKVGSEFQVNSFTTAGQGSSYYYLENNSALAMAANGNFVVVWGSYDADGLVSQDGDGASVHGQRFNASGARVGAEFRINTNTTGDQVGPSVAMRDDNSFVVTWTTPDGDAYGIHGQRYDAGGSPVGGEFNVPSDTAGNQIASSVRTNGTGQFTVVWTSADELVARRFDTSGAAIGAQFQVNTYTVDTQYTYGFGIDRRGNFVVNWNNGNDGSGLGVSGRRFSVAGTPREAENPVPLTTAGDQFEGVAASDDVGNVVSVWTDFGRDGGFSGVYGQRFGGLRPSALALDAANNSVWEPGETAEMRPSWRNINGAAQTFGGTLSNLTGPPGATYTITDATASYGTVANNTAAPCVDCYMVQVNDPNPRPLLHWDASTVESITPVTQGQEKGWTVHIGRSFSDVPLTNPFYRFIETLLHFSITSGCGGGNYCPGNNTTRGEMSVFVLVAKEGPGFAPPACTTPVFADVPASNPFCRFIEELFRRNVVGGCGTNPLRYCPDNPVTRAQMSVFVLLTLDGTLNPPACTTPVFADVPASDPFCKWIEELFRRGVVGGCATNPLRYCPNDAVTREQMGVFISATFGLTLYGP